MARRRRYSRLSRKEGKRFARQTTLLTLLTVFLLIALIFWGIPSLIKMAVFLADLRSSSQPITGEDVLPPPPPVLQPLPTATNSAVVRIHGFSEEGATVVLSINNADAYETLVESDGEFLFNSVSLKSGENRISARAIDPAGNESQASSQHIVNFDSEAPSLSLESPEDGASFFGSREKSLNVKGSVEGEARVIVNGFIVIPSQDGSFSHLLQLNVGENTIAVVARDRAGNETVITRTVTYAE